MSDRVFGVAWVCIFCAIALFRLLTGAPVHWGWGIPLAALAGVTALRPTLLAPLNRLWQAFGKVMHTLVSTIALVFLYFLIFTPGAWGLRLFGRNVMPRAFESKAQSYWTRPDTTSPPDFTRPF